jgi:glycosyltransferase involved in cell wall biosynthesis
VTEKGERLLSILMPTLESRREQCDRLQRELERQITQLSAEHTVEILTLRDHGSGAVGAKRNQLVERARGRFIVFVDDDDWVSRDYVARILQAIQQQEQADCISLAGEITFRGKHPKKMKHSVRFKEWHYSGGEYLRPPCHITPVRRDIAARYPFAEVDFAEDMDWTLRMSRDAALASEAVVDDVLYFYRCRRPYFYQWLLDRTQPLRHVLGLRFADGNKLRKLFVWRS